MQIGQEIPKIRHIPTAADFNKISDIVNILRKINFGTNMSGSFNNNGIFFDARSSNSNIVGDFFPIGDKWAYGISFNVDGDRQKISIHNPMIQRVGITVTPWFLSGGPITGFPDKTKYDIVIADSDWAKVGSSARTLIYESYDQTDNTVQYLAANSAAAGSTFPTDDGGDTYDAGRYIKTPLYILSSVYNGTVYSIPSIYIDLIHGTQIPALMG